MKRITNIFFAIPIIIIAGIFQINREKSVTDNLAIIEELPVLPETHMLETSLELIAEGDLAMEIRDPAIKEQAPEDLIKPIIDETWRQFPDSLSPGRDKDLGDFLNQSFKKGGMIQYTAAAYDGLIAVKVTGGINTYYVSKGEGHLLLIDPKRSAKDHVPPTGLGK